MATPYPGNVTPLAQPAPETSAEPIIRTIGLPDLSDLEVHQRSRVSGSGTGRSDPESLRRVSRIRRRSAAAAKSEDAAHHLGY